MNKINKKINVFILEHDTMELFLFYLNNSFKKIGIANPHFAVLSNNY